MQRDTEVGLGPKDIVLDGDPAPQKGHSPKKFRPTSIVVKRSPISATSELVSEQRPLPSNYNSRNDEGVQNVSWYQILCRSLKPFLRYGDFSIFQNGGRHHVGFLKLTVGWVNMVTTPNFMAIGQTIAEKYGDFLFFKMVVATILDF